MEVQVRINGTLNFFPTVKESFQFLKQNMKNTTEDLKISWGQGEQDFRFLIKKKEDVWNKYEEPGTAMATGPVSSANFISSSFVTYTSAGSSVLASLGASLAAKHLPALARNWPDLGYWLV